MFHKDRRKKDGLNGCCKDCQRVKNARWNPVHNPVTNKNPKYDDVRALAADRRRHREKQTHIEGVGLNRIYERDQGICYLCLEYVPREVASRDHVIPISRGGSTCWDNLKLAHMKCNTRKRDKLLEELDLTKFRKRVIIEV